TTPGSVEIVGTAVNPATVLALNRHTNLRIIKESVLVRDKNNASLPIRDI
ncbi:unnamed protein product, partial [Allacma fusca]